MILFFFITFGESIYSGNIFFFFLLLHLLLSEKQTLSKMSPPTFYTLLFNDSHNANIFSALLAGGTELNRIELNSIVSFFFFFSPHRLSQIKKNVWT